MRSRGLFTLVVASANLLGISSGGYICANTPSRRHGYDQHVPLVRKNPIQTNMHQTGSSSSDERIPRPTAISGEVPVSPRNDDSNTNQDREERLVKLHRALQKMDQLMSLSNGESVPIRPFLSSLTKSVQVQKSSIHGMGLVATRNIKQGSLLCLYPAHAIGSEQDGFVWESSDDNQNAYFQNHAPSLSSFILCTDQPFFSRTSLLQTDDSLYIDVNPTIMDLKSTAWVSHFINDGSTVQNLSEEGILEYYQRSNAARNCIHIPFGPSPVLATIATRKIKKGDELLTTYGSLYWLGESRSMSGGEPVVDWTKVPSVKLEMQASALSLQTAVKGVDQVYASEIKLLSEFFGGNDFSGPGLCSAP